MADRILSPGEPEVPLHHHWPWSVVILTTDGGRQPLGTAFGVEVSGSTYLVTAAHVVQRPRVEIAARVVDYVGGIHDVPVAGWVPHPIEDVAVAPFAPPLQPVIRMGFLPTDVFLPAGPEDRHVMLGQDVLFIGLLKGLPAMAAEGVPMVRTGTVGRLNQKGVPVKAPNGGVLKFTAHLIDCRAYQGMSGAPCFSQRVCLRPGAGADPSGPPDTHLITQTYLFGLISAHFDDNQPLRGDSMGVTMPVHTGVGVVTPVRFLRETLDDPQLKEERGRRAAESAEPEPSPAVADMIGAEDPGPTADLMGKLLQVPKDEATDQ